MESIAKLKLKPTLRKTRGFLDSRIFDLISVKNKIKDDHLAEINKKILDSVPVSIVVLNKEGCIMAANKHYYHFSKTKNPENYNIFESNFFIRENLVDDYRVLLEKGKIIKKDACFDENSKGKARYLSLLAVPIRDKNGNIEGAISMAQDNTTIVSYKKKLEDMNKNLEAMVKERTLELKNANKKLTNVMNLRSIFMSDVSHEMRTAMAIVQGNIELMTRFPGVNSEERFEQITGEVKRMSDMLTDLSLLMHNNPSQQAMISEAVDIHEMIRSIVNSLNVVAVKKNVQLKHKLRGQLLMDADGGKLEKLILNLMRNGIRYNKENGGELKIWTEEKGEDVYIKVKDNGIGIAKEHLPFIFERFYRADKSRTRNDDGGSGLGLAICKWVVELHGGRIGVSSTLGKGSLFTVIIPKKRPLSSQMY